MTSAQTEAMPRSVSEGGHLAAPVERLRGGAGLDRRNARRRSLRNARRLLSQGIDNRVRHPPRRRFHGRLRKVDGRPRYVSASRRAPGASLGHVGFGSATSPWAENFRAAATRPARRAHPSLLGPWLEQCLYQGPFQTRSGALPW